MCGDVYNQDGDEMIIVLNDKERSILSIARTLHNVHGPKYFAVDAYLSMTAYQYRIVSWTISALMGYGYIEGKEPNGRGGVRITAAGLEYFEGR
jgi:hypothetical protein